MKLIVANWKMYLTLSQSVALAKRISNFEFRISNFTLVLCPSFIALEEVAKALRGTLIKLGAQDVEPERRGAFTGEVGLDDLRSLHVEYVLVGHSERRRYFKETDAVVNVKLRAVLASGMRPILCVGESWSIRRGRGEIGFRRAKRYVAAQLRKGLKGVSKNDSNRMVIAYEPVWAIGTGRADSPEDASKMHAHIRKVVRIKSMPILYGGSVNAKNAAEFLRAPGVDGLLVGRASVNYRKFADIIKTL